MARPAAEVIADLYVATGGRARGVNATNPRCRGLRGWTRIYEARGAERIRNDLGTKRELPPQTPLVFLLFSIRVHLRKSAAKEQAPAPVFSAFSLNSPAGAARIAIERALTRWGRFAWIRRQNKGPLSSFRVPLLACPAVNAGFGANKRYASRTAGPLASGTLVHCWTSQQWHPHKSRISLCSLRLRLHRRHAGDFS